MSEDMELSGEVRAILQRVTDTGVTEQEAVEYALKHTYGEDPRERERIMAETKKAYLDAVAELFRLLELPASLKSPDHRELLMAANDACGTARTAMLAAWEGEENEQWQR